MDCSTESNSPRLRRCIHSRLIESHFLNSADITDLFTGNIFLKQHVKKCTSCKKIVENGIHFWNFKEKVLENRKLAPRQRELFLSEVDHLFSEFENKIAAIDEISSGDKMRQYFYRLSGELLSPKMLVVYSLISFFMIVFYLLV